MTHKKNPAERGSASRAPNVFSLAANSPETISQPLVTRQSEFVARRFGLSAAVAAVVASHAFKTEARQ